MPTIQNKRQLKKVTAGRKLVMRYPLPNGETYPVDVQRTTVKELVGATGFDLTADNAQDGVSAIGFAYPAPAQVAPAPAPDPTPDPAPYTPPAPPAGAVYEPPAPPAPPTGGVSPVDAGYASAPA